MATYFTRYYLEFQDNHVTNTITWRADILDSQGNAPTEPYQLIPSSNPLITERINSDDDKFSPIIGRQITLTWKFTGNPNEPTPDLFFEADERRFRVEIRKNGALDGVYYVKPDYCTYPDLYDDFDVSLKAVDGLGYVDGTLFNAFNEDGLLFYEKTTIYDALVTRGLFQIFDPGTVVNVMCSLKPVGYDPNFLLTDNYVHTDLFYDFITGPKSVKDVIMAFCMAFNMRLITDQNQIWLIRVQDTNYESYVIEQYIDAETVNTITLNDFVASVGWQSFNDAQPINVNGGFTMLPALKRAEFEVEYKSINQLRNFQWEIWDGQDFQYWTRELTVGQQVTLERVGSGSITDPYRAFYPYPNNPTAFRFWQLSPNQPVQPGDLIEFEIKVDFYNVKEMGYRVILVDDPTNPAYNTLFVLGSGGEWLEPGQQSSPIARSGKKRTANLRIRSNPVPAYAFNGDGPYNSYGIRLELIKPIKPEALDPGFPDGVEIYPVKLGIISLAAVGRHVTVTNPGNFSRVQEEKTFSFIDTREDGVSNTIFTGSPDTFPGGWSSDKPGVVPGDIERQMAIAYIDQYQRSVTMYEGAVYSNTINFYNILTKDNKPGKKFLQIGDTYNNRTCDHDIKMVEVFEEYSAEFDQQFNYLEYDIQETNND